MKYIFYIFIFVLTNMAFEKNPVVAALIGALMIQYMEVLLLVKGESVMINNKNNYEKTGTNTDVPN